MLRTYLTSVWSRCTQIWCVLTIFLESRYENHYLSSEPLFGKNLVIIIVLSKRTEGALHRKACACKFILLRADHNNVYNSNEVK